jgi:formate dehydrogenase major subunit
MDAAGIPMKDKTLKDPNCVFQLMKKQYARYTPETVNRICGTSQGDFLKVCRAFTATGKTGKAGNILYAMGTTQHTVGAQNIRAYAIIQMLLANIGVAGGGIQAMRGESNVQGSTDFGLLYHILTSYLKNVAHTDTTLAKHLERVTPVTKDPNSANWWGNTPKYVVSLLKAWYGANATKDNEFAFQYLPKIDSRKNYSHIALFEAMEAGTIKGLMVWGQNPAVGGPNANQERSAMAKLDWMLVADLWHTETANFWRRPGVNPADIKTEVFLLPALNSYEKEGSVTNSGRWIQWRYKAADGPGEAHDDLWMMDKIFRRVKALYEKESGPAAEAITKMVWDYGADHPDVHRVAKEINGYDLNTSRLMGSFANLKDDGSTSCGAWVYCGSYTESGNMMARRDPTPDMYNIGLYPNWAYAWPLNRRIVYNRASVDLNGIPFDQEHPVIWWKDGKWTGDVPDGGFPPIAVDPKATRWPFIMTADGHGRLFGPGMAEGPLPEHYEPWESPVKNLLSRQQFNPAINVWRAAEQGTVDKYPIIGCTYRVTEHWQAGQMTRNLPWLVEMQPEPFVEISEQLASEKGISNGDRVIVESARGQVKMVALVTKRLQPFVVDGKTVHEVGMVWHFGYTGLATGDSANLLTPHVGDANTMIPEYKAFLVNIRKA